MNVLIAYECSGNTRNAFRDLGHNAFSVDLKPSKDDSPYHFTCDAGLIMIAHDTIANADQWDLIIMHPPCTALAVSGNSTYAKGKPKYDERIKAIKRTTTMFKLAQCCAKSVCMENPVGVLPIKPTQYIQPYEFGHPESKKTGLWLHNLEPLKETNNVKYIFDRLPKSKQQRLHWLPPSEDRAEIRSITFPGISKAMAEQWGCNEKI